MSSHWNLAVQSGVLGDSFFPFLPSSAPCRVIHGGALGTMTDTFFMTVYNSANAVFTGTMTITFKRSVSLPGFKLGVSWHGVIPCVAMEDEGSCSNPECKEEFLLLLFSWTNLNLLDVPFSSKDKVISLKMGYVFQHKDILHRMMMNYFWLPLI